MRHVFLNKIISKLVFAGDQCVNFVTAQGFYGFLLIIVELMISRDETSFCESFNVRHIVVLQGFGFWMARIMNCQLIEVKKPSEIPLYYGREQ